MFKIYWDVKNLYQYILIKWFHVCPVQANIMSFFFLHTCLIYGIYTESGFLCFDQSLYSKCIFSLSSSASGPYGLETKLADEPCLKFIKPLSDTKKNTLLAVFMISIKSWFRLEKILCLRFTHYFQIPDPRLIQQLHFFSSLCCVSFVYQLVHAYEK